jgi:hypothetical protein
MHQSVIDSWRKFNDGLEGVVPSMYLDTHDPPLVTCAVGILIDPVSLALSLPWKRDADGQPATQEQIRSAWSLLKSHPEYAHRSTASARALTKLHLDEAAVAAVVAKKLSDNQAFLVARHFPLFERFPADAQMGILSMAWAVGADFPRKFTYFKAAVLAGNWLTARDECSIQDASNRGVTPRNAANRVCFANAEIVERCGMDPAALNWPNVAQGDVHPTDRAANLGTLVAAALDDARVHALEVERLEALRDMSGSSAPPPPLANS